MLKFIAALCLGIAISGVCLAADQPKSMSDLLKSFPDNTSELIQPSDVRNLVASIYGPGSSLEGLTNVMTLSCGVPIADGAAHVVAAAPPGSCFHGITTLAGLSAININGSTPFSFLTDAGTKVGPLCTAATPVNCFLNGVYNLTDAKVPNIDIAWLAIQAAELTGKTYIPAGQYIIGSVFPLPVMIPHSDEASGQIAGSQPSMTRGDGQRLSILTNGSDFGTNVPLVSCEDPAASLSNQLGRYSVNTGPGCAGDIRDISIRSSVNGYSAPNVTPINMDGFAWGPRLRITDVESSFWNNDMTAVGDHTLWIRLHLFGGRVGLRWLTPNANFGDIQTIDLNVSGQSFASISAAPGNSFIGVQMAGETYLSAPVAIYGEPDGGTCSALMASVSIDRLMTEFIRMSFVWDGTGFNGTTYTDSNKCRSVNSTTFKQWFGSFITDQDAFWATQNIFRRASIDIGGLNLFRIENITPSGGGMVPNFAASSFNVFPAPVVNPHAVAFINAVGVNNADIAGARISGDIGVLISEAGTLPLFSGQSFVGTIELDTPGAWSGRLGQLVTAGNYTATRAGDCIETSAFTQVAPCGANNNISHPAVRGIAMQGGIINNGYVPVADHGIVTANSDWAGFTFGFWRAHYGVGPVTFVAGTGGTPGTYTWTATGGGCGTEPVGTIVVAGGHITSATQTNTGDGCTSQPSVPVPGGASLSGASITLQWPSGIITPSSGPITDGPVLGQASGGAQPSPGNNTETLWLQGLN